MFAISVAPDLFLPERYEVVCVSRGLDVSEDDEEEELRGDGIESMELLTCVWMLRVEVVDRSGGQDPTTKDEDPACCGRTSGLTARGSEGPDGKGLSTTSAPPVTGPPLNECSGLLVHFSFLYHILMFHHPFSPMIPLIVPSLIATPTAVKTEGFLTVLGAQVEMHGD
ncbi:hypothetical protein Tco_0679843 [Tanacetum coccineum]|uniref:Uncharacterized protein n=1 Tax=Tanacetum coccineum TaxID=301880 RepID=A0ABQ4XJ85_9ASTR